MLPIIKNIHRFQELIVREQELEIIKHNKNIIMFIFSYPDDYILISI